MDSRFVHWLHVMALQVQANQRDTAWASYTNILGFSVMGIWHDNGTDGTDINAVCRCAPDGLSCCQHHACSSHLVCGFE
jgi:hypothetical protein